MRWLFLLFLPLFTAGFCLEHKAFQFVEAEALLKASDLRKSSISLHLEGKTLPSWMENTILEEVAAFSSFTEAECENFFSSTWQTLFHFRIRNGKLYVRCNENGLFPPMTEYAAAIFYLLQQPGCSLTHGDFFLNFADTVAKNKTSFPILCFCKDPESNYIMVPDGWAIWKDRIHLMKQIDRTCRAYPWEKKIPQAFWMGALNGLFLNEPLLWRTNQRSRVVLFSLEHPDLLFAKFPPFLNEDRVCDEMKAMHSLLSVPRTSQLDACTYKYLLDVEGWGCGFHRTQWILRSNCVCVKQRGPNTQWHYNGLKPYVHYVPYESDCSDLLSVLEWLRTHDNEAKSIALHGHQYALDYLNTDITYLYLYRVLLELSKLCLN
jgi:hypothetical protein